MTTYIVSAGASSGYALRSGDYLIVEAGGESDASTVSSGAREDVRSGALSEGDSILSGGELNLYADAFADNLLVASGGLVQASTADLTGYATVAGRLVSGVLGPYGYGGTLEIASGGLTEDLSVIDGFVDIQSGGSATDTVVQLGDGYEDMAVDAGGTATATTVNGLLVDSGLISRTAVIGGEDYVYGSAVETSLELGGVETVEAGGVSIGARVVGFNTSQSVQNGGLASATVVSAGGVLILSQGGVAKGVVVEASGLAEMAVTLSSGQHLIEGGDAIAVSATQSVNGVTLESGAYLVALDPTVESGGILVQLSGAFVSDVIISAGGRLSGGVIGGGAPGADTDAGLVSGVTLDQNDGSVGQLEVLSGGVAYSVQVTALAELDVLSGGLASSASVSGADSLLQVEAGGYARGAIIGGAGGASGPSAVLYGSSLIDMVQAGGVEFVEAGGLASRTTVSSGGTEIVSSGGKVIGCVVLSGGAISLAVGAIATGEAVSSGAIATLTLDVTSGQLFRLPPQVTTQTQIIDGVNVSAGGILKVGGATVQSGGLIYLEGGVLSNGVTISTGGIVDGSGTVLGQTLAGGEIENFTLGEAAPSGVDLVVTSGGVARYAQVNAAILTASSGAKLEDITASNGGLLTVASGARAISLQIEAGGALQVVFGADVDSATVSSGASLSLTLEAVAAGATATVGVVSASTSSGGATVLSGGSIEQTDLTVSSGGVLDLEAGGLADSLSIVAGGVVSGPGELVGETVNSGVLSDALLTGDLIDFYRVISTTVASDGFVTVEAGALAYKDILSAGGGQLVLSGALTSGSVIDRGGMETVGAGASAYGTILSSGGSQLVSSGGLVSGAIVRAGGVEVLSSRAMAQGVTVSSGGVISMTADVSSGQTLSVPAPGGAVTLAGVTVLSGGALDLTSTAIDSGGTVILASGATLSNVYVKAGARLVGGGDLASLQNSGEPPSTLADQGLISGVTVGETATTYLTVYSGGAVENVTLYYGTINVLSGGSAAGVRLDPCGGFQFLTTYQGGVTSAAVLGRGVESVGGESIGTTIDSSALQQVVAFGSAVGAVVASNGQQWLLDGARASDTTVLSGGELFLDPQATIMGAYVSSGGALDLGKDGGATTSGQTLSAGVVSATTVVGGVTVSSGGAVIYDDLVVNSGAHVVFGSKGALGDVTVQSGALVSGSGTLFDGIAVYGVIDGVTVGPDPFFAEDPLIAFDLPEEYHQSSGTQFIETGGVGSGVQIVSGGDLQVFGGGAFDGFAISSGGDLLVDSGASALSGRVLAGGFEEAADGTALSGTVVSSGGELQDDTQATAGAGQTLYQGVQSTLTSAVGAHVSSGGVLHYADVVVESGGVLSIGSPSPTGVQYAYDSLAVSHGGVVSGAGELGGATLDAGLVSGVAVGDPTPPRFSIPHGTLEISSGGVASAVTVTQSSTLLVDAGGVFSSGRVSGGEVVSSGGIDRGGVVASGGSATFETGASAQGVTVSSGGEAALVVVVSSGQTLDLSTNLATATTTTSGVTVQSGGTLDLKECVVSSGGVLSLGAAVSAGDTFVSAGGVVMGGTIYSLANPQGLPDILGVTIIDGLAQDTTIDGYAVISSGGLGRDLSVAEGELDLYAGAVVSGLDVGANGQVGVFGGAVLNDAVLEAGTAEYSNPVEIYGSAIGDSIDSGRSEVVQGGYDTGAVVGFGGALILNSGAVANATVLSGGLFANSFFGEAQVTVSSGGRDDASFEYVNQGETLVDGAVASAITIYGVTLLSGAIVDYSAEVQSGGVLSVTSGGEAGGLSLDTGALVIGTGVLAQGGQNGGTIERVTLLGGLTDNGVTSDVVIGSGGVDDLNGHARYGRILSGGSQIVNAGATVLGEVISAGGSAMIDAGAVISSLTVSSGGSATIQAVVSSGQTDVLSSAAAGGTDVFGQITVAAGGSLVLQSAAVLAGGHLVLGSGVVVPGGAYVVTSSNAGGSVTTYQVNAGVTVSSGASLSGAGAVAGVLTVSAGGFASGVSILSGGTDMLASGGKETNVSVASGASLVLAGDMISSGQTVQDGAVTAAEVVGGASAAIGAVVTVSGATVSSGGSLQVLALGSATDIATLAGGALVDNGGVTYDASGSTTLAGSLSGAGDLIISGAAVTLVESGSAAGYTGSAVIGGEYDSNVSGTLELANAGGLGSGAVVFAGDTSEEAFATLQVDAPDTPANGGTFANALEDFNVGAGTLDLRGLAYSSGASATVAGDVLTLKDGARTAKFTLIGQGALSFTVASDKHGGTLITPTSDTAQNLVQAAAAFEPSASPTDPSIKTRSTPPWPAISQSLPHPEAQIGWPIRMALA